MVSLRGQYWEWCCLIFINDTDSGFKCTFSNFVDDIKCVVQLKYPRDEMTFIET